jgi:hypothetical protein
MTLAETGAMCGIEEVNGWTGKRLPLSWVMI